MTELTEHSVPDASASTLEVTITYLEMSHHAIRNTKVDNPDEMLVTKVNKPSLNFYRYLYQNIGGPWRWYERRILNDDQLRSIIHSSNVSIYVLYFQGSPAGYFELDERVEHQVELAYFGLFPQYIGQGLGSWLLDRAMAAAWQNQPRRVWVNTCTLDHPSALPFYQKAGFKIYRKKVINIRDPWLESYWDGTFSNDKCS